MSESLPPHATDGATLPEATRRLHRALIAALLDAGEVPPAADLAAAAAIAPAELAERLAALAAADYLALDARGRLTCLYPFSPVPTSHVVQIGARRRYAMCAIDALGLAAMLGERVAIDATCGECGAPVAITVAPDAIVAAEPATAVVVAAQSGDEPACAACCPSTLFACSPPHAEALLARLPRTRLLSLAAALRHGETIFGDLLGPRLPARRRRSSLAGGDLLT